MFKTFLNDDNCLNLPPLFSSIKYDEQGCERILEKINFHVKKFTLYQGCDWHIESGAETFQHEKTAFRVNYDLLTEF